MRDQNVTTDRPLRALDFFCGAGGMSYGLRQAGVDVVAGMDIDYTCEPTYTHAANEIGAQFIRADIDVMSPSEIESLGIERGCDSLVFVGCSPCQYWSKINTSKTKAAKSKHLLERFGLFVEHFLPGYVVVENVPGLLTKRNEAVLSAFLGTLRRLGYVHDAGVVDLKSYGVPQKRRRYILIATRLSESITLPGPSADVTRMRVRDFIGPWNGFPEVADGHRDDSDFMHVVSSLSPKNRLRIRKTPADGGDRLGWSKDEDLQIEAYRHRDDCFRDVYGRMAWDQPAPTITTRFNNLSNGRFGHPEEHRAISLREGATLQTFPKTFVFKGSIPSIARQIGNAVPPELGRRIGRYLINHRGQIQADRPGS
jgi:DNA (cytosine-5)-methyltransferase 1